MRLAFPNGDHEEVTIGKGSISIGSSDDDDVVIKSEGIQPGHAVIIVDKRGITLAVEVEDDPVKVNDRSVRGKAILRLGDSLHFQDIPMILRADESRLATPPTPDDAPMVDPEPESAAAMPPKYLLRCVAGPHFGTATAIETQVVIGQQDACDVVLSADSVASEHARIENTKAGVILRNIGSENGTEVNGNQVLDAILNAGDQIRFGHERFVLEAPGFVPGKVFGGVEEEEAESSNTQVFSALDLSQDASSPAPAKEEEQQPEQAPAAAAAEDAGAGKTRDAVIIGVCLVLSAAMLLWLYMNI